MTEERILDKVRALLAKAEDAAATPSEAEVYTAKALELMARYSIDQALLAADGKIEDKVINRKIVVLAPYSKDKAMLLHQVARNNRVDTIRLISRGRNYDDQGRPAPEASTVMHLFGFESDIAAVELIYTSLQLQATAGMLAAPVPPWENAKAYRRSWLIGFAAAVNDRMKQAAARAEAESPERAGGSSTALVLVDRTKAAQDALRTVYPRVRVSTSSYTGSGRSRGYAAGERADLGGARVGGTSRPSLGR